MIKMIKHVDAFLNSITMYRLVLCALVILALFAVVFAFFGIVPLSPLWLFVSAAALIAVCETSNRAFARLFNAPPNVESSSITALILFFVMTPASGLDALLYLSLVGAVAMATKYIIMIRKRHILNPAAAGAVIAGIAGIGSSSWWISISPFFLPIVLVLGLCIVRKLRRFRMFFSFMAAGIVSFVSYSAIMGTLGDGWQFNLPYLFFASWPTIFFSTIMLTEPLTTPPKKRDRIIYGALVGALFGAPVALGGFYLTSETALVLGNMYSYIVSFRRRMVFWLREKREIAASIFEFVFEPEQRLQYEPGQFLEWTLRHNNFDSRGVRRYFTIASSPTEARMKIGVKIIGGGSSFKSALKNLSAGENIVAGEISGEFTLPKNKEEKMVFIAGGIGITPFRSMAKFLLDNNERRDIVLFYFCSDPAEFAYGKIFEKAQEIGLKTIYVITGKNRVPAHWRGKAGFLNDEMIRSEVSGFRERTYYISGPEVMVKSYKKLLASVGISSRRIKTDYFPGY